MLTPGLLGGNLWLGQLNIVFWLIVGWVMILVPDVVEVNVDVWILRTLKKKPGLVMIVTCNIIFFKNIFIFCLKYSPYTQGRSSGPALCNLPRMDQEQLWSTWGWSGQEDYEPFPRFENIIVWVNTVNLGRKTTTIFWLVNFTLTCSPVGIFWSFQRDRSMKSLIWFFRISLCLKQGKIIF